MSYRTNIIIITPTGEEYSHQLFSNNDGYTDWLDFMITQGAEIDEVDWFYADTEIKDVQKMLEVVSKISYESVNGDMSLRWAFTEHDSIMNLHNILKYAIENSKITASYNLLTFLEEHKAIKSQRHAINYLPMNRSTRIDYTFTVADGYKILSSAG